MGWVIIRSLMRLKGSGSKMGSEGVRCEWREMLQVGVEHFCWLSEGQENWVGDLWKSLHQGRFLDVDCCRHSQGILLSSEASGSRGVPGEPAPQQTGTECSQHKPLLSGHSEEEPECVSLRGLRVPHPWFPYSRIHCQRVFDVICECHNRLCTNKSATCQQKTDHHQVLLKKRRSLFGVYNRLSSTHTAVQSHHNESRPWRCCTE